MGSASCRSRVFQLLWQDWFLAKPELVPFRVELDLLGTVLSAWDGPSHWVYRTVVRQGRQEVVGESRIKVVSTLLASVIHHCRYCVCSIIVGNVSLVLSFKRVFASARSDKRTAGGETDAHRHACTLYRRLAHSIGLSLYGNLH